MATQVTLGVVDEGELLLEMPDLHRSNTHSNVETVVADGRLWQYRELSALF
jgi:hypothetical protein